MKIHASRVMSSVRPVLVLQMNNAQFVNQKEATLKFNPKRINVENVMMHAVSVQVQITMNVLLAIILIF